MLKIVTFNPPLTFAGNEWTKIVNRINTLTEEWLSLRRKKQNRMKSKRKILLVLMAGISAMAQAAGMRQDTIGCEEPVTNEIQLSPKFQKELWNAFTLDPIPAPVEEKTSAIPLDRKLLHEWVGAVAIEHKVEPLVIPGLTSNLKSYAPQAVCFDANVLGQYIRPKEIMLRKMHELAAEAREVMDRVYPTDGLPRPIPSDTARVDSASDE